MSSGYFQLRLADGDNGKGITAFMCEAGIFRWNVVPMGMQPSSDKLAWQMEQVFKELFAPDGEGAAAGSSMVRDIDDFIGGARTQEEFYDVLEKFLDRCHDRGIYLNPAKFQIAMERDATEEEIPGVLFAGILVQTDGTFAMDPRRTDAIKKFPIPRTRKQLESWIGLCTSLNQFAPQPMHAVMPLQRKLLYNTYRQAIVWDNWPEVKKQFKK